MELKFALVNQCDSTSVMIAIGQNRVLGKLNRIYLQFLHQKLNTVKLYFKQRQKCCVKQIKKHISKQTKNFKCQDFVFFKLSW